MIRNIFRGVMNVLNLNKRKRQAERILSGKEEATHTVHQGMGRFRHTKGAGYLRNAIAKRRTRRKMRKLTRQGAYA